jgi:DNA-binding response OmpR family regulator
MHALRILVVDDNRDLADSLKEILSIEGHDVRVAYHGEQALNVAPVHEPHVVIVDIMMPDVSGFDATVQLRKQGWSQSAVFVAHTARDQAVLSTRPEIRFDLFLRKPATVSSLSKAIDLAHARLAER